MRWVLCAAVIVLALVSLSSRADAQAAPSLVVLSVRLSPQNAMVGGLFNVEMLISNVGSLNALTAQVELDLNVVSGTPFSMIGSGTVLNVGALGVGANKTLDASIAVSLRAATGTYNIPYTLTYSDENYYSYEYGGTFGVVVTGIPDVQIQSITLNPLKLTQNTLGTLSLSLIDAGTEDAENVTVSIYNDGGMFTTTVLYVGQLARGATNTVDFGINVAQDAPIGTQLVNITLTFKDPSGTPYENSRIYELNVYPSQPLIQTYDIGLILLAVAVVMGAFIAYSRLVRR